MDKRLRIMVAVGALAAAGAASAQITFYEHEGFRGRAVTAQDRVWNFERYGFNDRASSVVVDRGWWEVCEHPRFEGRCAVLRHGSYPSLRSVGLNNAISSARPVEPGYGRRREHEREHEGPPVAYAQPPVYAPQPAYAPPPPVAPAPAFYDVPVASARAVVGPPQQRCWVEREQVAQPRSNDPNVGGAVLGGIVGGILGHQVGGGSGKDLATVGGVVAGAAIGANVNRGGVGYENRDVQRCQNVTNAQPAYWDVTYTFRGVEHRVQTASAPGAMIRVDASGAPVVAR